MGNEYADITGGWFIADNGPHNLPRLDSGFIKEEKGIYNRITTVWSGSNLSTKNHINFTNYSNLCFDMEYYIPKQERTGQGIYYGVTLDGYTNARVADYLAETDNQTSINICIDVSNINGYGYPFIEIYNGHTQIPYDGWIANTYIYLRRIYLQ